MLILKMILTVSLNKRKKLLKNIESYYKLIKVSLEIHAETKV